MVSSPAVELLNIPEILTATVLAALVCKPAILLVETVLLAAVSIATPNKVPPLVALLSLIDAAAVVLPIVLALTMAEPPKMRMPYHDAFALLR